MLIGLRQKLSTLSSQSEPSIDDVPLQKVTSVKLLGIRWQSINYFIRTPTLHCIYNALIQSQFDYCNVAWGNCGKTLFDRLQKLQNHAARVLTFSRYDADANLLFRQLNWKDLSTQFQMQKALMVCKSLNDLVPRKTSRIFLHLNFWFLKYCVHGIHEKQVLVRLVVDNCAYCLG